MTFGKKLKELRKQSNLTQEQLSKKLNLTRQSVAKWENGAGLPDIDNLKKLSNIFNLSIDQLIDYKVEDIDIPTEQTVEKCNEKSFKKIREFVINKFFNADEIYELSHAVHLKLWQEVLYFFMDLSGVEELCDFVKNGVVYSFYVKEGESNYLVLIKKSTLMTKKLENVFEKKSFIVDGYKYKKIKKIK